MIETTSARPTFVAPSWLPPATEESVMGTQWHQEAIDGLASILVEVGRRTALGGASLAGSSCWIPAPAS